MDGNYPINRPDLNRPEFRRMTQERLVRLSRLKNPTAKECVVVEALAAVAALQAAWDGLSTDGDEGARNV
ncbi:hypothetical protein AB3M83_08980 [Microbacterium sp. 179-B 1A2 NHS]|uniref:hypothetical protein n=1 Tax=Microbacterium sp. 179-B 1A2 NHS TaxID=3142383 RepID=UPI0039A0CD2B